MRNSNEMTAPVSWPAALDPVSKLLLILLFTIAAFSCGSLLSSGLLVLASLLVALFAKNSRALWGMCAFSLFLIVTMLLIQGLFWPQNHTAAFRLAGATFYQEGLVHASLLACRILVIIFASSFFMQTTTVSENARYLEACGLSYQQVYILMSVCYILPQMRQNLQKIQLAQKARGIAPARSLASRAKNLFPVLLPLIVKSFQEAMNRSISLQLRGYGSPRRRPATLRKKYWREKLCHRFLLAACVALLGGKACQMIFS
ncbi:ABC transporter permease [Lactobacillus nasalidis]|uniref:ABC transporter permease n=1 Tax=Lactobacillus nasalidis TaxID=2797258 RepID=A0ABQ3W4X4_9LACO|nr:energy-coupling factor transporter transmembrane component T [Lactobacillus nasalidis]GHV96819.1 ABC transporter permease [Lactobacillus nasalidis]GHV98871.1 ABC transporter permease [Lactobacillus nasalidis]GHW01018.1 ABC transporter permease [Lactobacillus nasalidis]